MASGVRAVVVRSNSTCALVNGGVRCWGQNDPRPTRQRLDHERPGPGQVPGMNAGVLAVAVGSFHACALARGIHCWGYNANGQLGNGSTTSSLFPVASSVCTL